MVEMVARIILGMSVVEFQVGQLQKWDYRNKQNP